MEKWIELEREIGYNAARVVAMAVSWCYRPDNWRFLAWYWKLSEVYKFFVDKYFNEFLQYEIKERSDSKSSDLSLLCKYFNLPLPVKLKPIIFINKPKRKRRRL